MHSAMLSQILTYYALFSLCSLSHGVAVKSNDVASTPAPAPAKTTSPILHKRADWVPVCPSGQSTNCPVIGVADITSDPAGHYIPVCVGTSCNWLGYEEPTASFSSGTTYEIVSTDTANPFIIPIPIPLPGEPLPPPPPGPPPPEPTGDLPDAPEAPETTDSSDPQTTPACSNPPDASTTPVGFEDDWFTDVLSDWSSTLTYFLDYELPLTTSTSSATSTSSPSSTSYASTYASPSPTTPAPLNSDCYTLTLIVWINDGGQNWDNMGFRVYGKYTGNSPYYPAQTVWDGNNAANAQPTLASVPGPLPLYLVEVYDHDKDWVQFNYGSQAWASSDSQCTDDHWGSDNGHYPLRTINCTFSC